MLFGHDIDFPESYRDQKVIYMSRYSVAESLYTSLSAKVTCGNDAFLHMSALCIKDRSKPVGQRWRIGDWIRFSGPLYPLK
jgi:hypothetical protein